jgi:hypothetical protein
MQIKYYKFKDLNVVYSIVMPIHNQQNIIIKNIKSILYNTVDNFEIILILDYCYDDTEKYIIDYFDNEFNNIYSNFIQLKIFKIYDKPYFETKCDNIGFKNSIGIYCLEIQADMEMTEYGYNIHLTKPFNLLTNVIAVSGRCSHNIFSGGGIGKLGTDVEKTIEELKINKNKFYVFESCCRGPLLIDRQKLIEINYLDEENFFQEFSDHEFMLRAYAEKKYICGYVPINYNSPLIDGTWRNNIITDCEQYKINKAEKKYLSEKLNGKINGKIDMYKKFMINKPYEEYDI